MNNFVLEICIKKMHGGQVGLLLWYQLKLLYSLPKKMGVGPPGSQFFFSS